MGICIGKFKKRITSFSCKWSFTYMDFSSKTSQTGGHHVQIFYQKKRTAYYCCKQGDLIGRSLFTYVICNFGHFY
jgi:hypothetical protein